MQYILYKFGFDPPLYQHMQCYQLLIVTTIYQYKKFSDITNIIIIITILFVH